MTLKITIQENDSLAETEIVIHCKKADEETLRLIAALSNLDKKLTGTRDGRTFVLDPADVLYFESVDKKTFAYTESDVYETPLRLYELEGRLPHDFFRASKSTIVSIGKIKSILPDFGGRLEVTLANGERLLVSRQYAQELKRKLEL
jgi:DNA-binding LytR/AlgR family response regulator